MKKESAEEIQRITITFDGTGMNVDRHNITREEMIYAFELIKHLEFSNINTNITPSFKGMMPPFSSQES